jgi:anti-anti-sigma factor
MKLFDLDVHEENGGVRIAVSGEVDLSAIEELESELAPALARSPDPLVVDLRDVAFLDSSGLRFLLGLNEQAARDGRRFALVAAGDPVERVLELAGIAERLEVVADPAELHG